MPNNPPAGPITLGTPPAQPARPTPAADALAASKAPNLNGWKKVLDIIGQARFPQIEQAIPGSPGNYRQQVRPLLEKKAAEEDKAAITAGTTAKDAAQIAEQEASARNLNAEAENRINPVEKPRGIIIKDENGDPIPALQNMKTGEITDDTGKPIPNAQVWEKPSAKKEDMQFGHTLADLKAEITTNPAKYPGGYMEGAAGFKNLKAAALQLDTDEANAKRGPKDTGARDDARSDRNYDFNVKELDKERAPLEAVMQKISAGMTNLDLNSAQADAFLAPQILTLSAGGAGSGLRMNEAEINRILQGRTTWESLKALANKYATDPQHPQIPVAQRQAMADILKAAQAKGTLKSSVIAWADKTLIDKQDDVKGQREAVATARALLTAIDAGKRVQRNKTTGEFRIAPGE